MLFNPQHIPYEQTKKFTTITLDYLKQSEAIRPFFAHPPTLEGIRQAIERKAKHPVNRPLLIAELEKQYEAVVASEAVKRNIQLLGSDHTFSVCTAHQPNLFTGPLYFIYKILHAIKLAASLQQQVPGYNFVPVYYMGSEDADFAELNHTYVNGQRIEWHKEQTGAVGRMLVDDKLIRLIGEIEGQLLVEDHGAEVIDLLRHSYTKGMNIQTATFQLVNEIYGKYGLVVLIPDNAAFKHQMLSVFSDDLFQQNPSSIVDKTSQELGKHFNVQAHPRAINLFYLKDNIRERIIKEDDHFVVHNTDIVFTEEALHKELEKHPERFSPNVILRGLYQETLLPNIAFIGGGGELAYWLQLKNLFEHYNVPYPVLVLRNSFLVIEKKWLQLIHKLKLTHEQIFLSELEILDLLIEQEGKKPKLNGELDKVEAVYEQINRLAAEVDSTLTQHVASLKARSIKQLLNLEKKMVRAERKKHAAVRNQVARLKNHLFPNNGLQERVENFSSLYSKWGSGFIDALYEASFSLEQQFAILTEDNI